MHGKKKELGNGSPKISESAFLIFLILIPRLNVPGRRGRKIGGKKGKEEGNEVVAWQSFLHCHPKLFLISVPGIAQDGGEKGGGEKREGLSIGREEGKEKDRSCIQISKTLSHLL